MQLTHLTLTSTKGGQNTDDVHFLHKKSGLRFFEIFPFLDKKLTETIILEGGLIWRQASQPEPTSNIIQLVGWQAKARTPSSHSKLGTFYKFLDLHQGSHVHWPAYYGLSVLQFVRAVFPAVNVFKKEDKKRIGWIKQQCDLKYWMKQLKIPSKKRNGWTEYLILLISLLKWSFLPSFI